MSKVNLNAVGNANDRLNQHEAKPEMGTSKRQKGSARSAAGEGIPPREKSKVKLGAELKRAHANHNRRENGNADPKGGKQL